MPRFLQINLRELASRGWWFGLTLLICCLAIDRAGADEETVSPAQIAKWIVQLDDDLYDLRESAQQGLESSGRQALEAAAKEAQSGSLESSTRALNVLLSWTESTDHELQFAALEKLVALPNRPIESGLAAELLADSREQVALKAIAAFGGRYRPAGGVLVVKQLPNLQVIIDSEWKGEHAGLKHLAAVRRAVTVSFYFAPLGDEVLEYLTALPNVRRIEFYGTPISEETAQQLKKQLPNATVLVTQGALLGIHGDGVRQGPVVILKANEGFAAAKAGLRKNDAITELDGEKIKDFRDLTKQIGKFKPGDTVELTILRDGKLMKKQVTFDRWGKKDMNDANEGAHQFLPAPRKIKLERR